MLLLTSDALLCVTWSLWLPQGFMIFLTHFDLSFCEKNVVPREKVLTILNAKRLAVHLKIYAGGLACTRAQ